MSFLGDERVLWLRQKVALTLEIPLDAFDQHFVDPSPPTPPSEGQSPSLEWLAWKEEELSATRKSKRLEEQQLLQKFLSTSSRAGDAIFFACRKWTEVVEWEEEIEVEIEEEEEEDEDENNSAVPEEGAVPVASAKEAEEGVPAAGMGPDGAPLPEGVEVVTEEEVFIPKTRKEIVKRSEEIARSELFVSVDRMMAEMHERTVALFIRSTDGVIPQTKNSATNSLNDYFEFQVMFGEVLQGIAHIMQHLYLPVVQKGRVSDAVTTIDVSASSSVDSFKSPSSTLPPTTSTEELIIDDGLRNELNLNISKFGQQIKHVVVQSRGDTRLNIPNITISNAAVAVEDAHTVSIIEAALENWTAVINAAVEAEHQKMSKTTRTPLGEIEFWRERNASLSVLYDQINAPRVQMMIQAMRMIDNPQINSFNFHFGELTKLYVEARDNVKFLTTLERHFKHITEGSFQTMLESMQSMVNGLRMVWVISRHYNSDERMAPLMENIADTLARRVREGVRLSVVLNMEFRSAIRLVQEARSILTQWSENYFRMRKRIEDLGSDHRWEFDRKALFGKTDYMSEICTNIIEIIEAIEHFRVFLGPELKAVTGDSAGIDEVIERVENLTVPLKIPFEEKIFDKTFEKSWEAIMARFRTSVSEIEKMTDHFIKDSFRKLRSAEGAFELVMNFKKIGSTGGATDTSAGGDAVAAAPRPSPIQQQIADRYQDILEQYLNELTSIKAMFNQYKDTPHLYKNFPPVAGAIAWARDLYHRAKRPILRFKKHGGLLDDTYGESVKAAYLEFARAVDNYSTDLYTEWEMSVTPIVLEKLRQSVLCSLATPVPQPGTKTVTIAVKGEGFVLPPPPYRVNFSHELRMIIKEARYLDKLGYRVPEAALNVTLQEKKYQEITRSLNEKLDEYDRLLNSLSDVDKKLLVTHIDELNKTIKGGFYPLNWTSQRIPAYIEDLRLALERFGSIISQVHKNADMINDIITKIENTLLVSTADFITAPTNSPNMNNGTLSARGAGPMEGTIQPMDLSEFFEIMEKRRTERLDALVHDYETIGDSFLMKIEEVVAKTATGSSPALAVYYHYWERRVYNAITQMVLRSLSAYLGMLKCQDTAPLFRVSVSLNGKEFLVSPSLTEVDKLISKGQRTIGESASQFVRWMNGTCIRTPPQSINSEDDEMYVYSFFQDISKNTRVVELTMSLNLHLAEVNKRNNMYLDGWRRYDKKHELWNPKRRQQIEKFRPTRENLDSAMGHFVAIRDSVAALDVIKDNEFLQIDMSAVALGVARQAELWKNDYGEVLLTTSRALLTRIQDRFTTLEGQVVMETSDLEQLKFVLNIIAEVQNMVQDIELEMLDLTERYRTLQRYNIAVPEDELQAALHIEERWYRLFLDSKTRDLRLVDTKRQFREVTSQQDKEFREVIAALRRQFLESGPGVPTTPLDEGVELLADTKKQLLRLNKLKAELINAQNLFDLDVRPYADLVQTQMDVEELSRVYELYTQFKEFQVNMSSMLWGDLDISLLQRGAEDFERQARKFPKELKELPTFKGVEAKLANFKEALPLVVSLKNDAMKSRHWQRLMEVTGVTFDVTLKTLTLSNIFSMELHRFTSVIEEIINEAVQEAKIENEIAKIEAAWRNHALILTKYKKDGLDRGYVLKAAEDLKLELEDNMLNLQTISGSRFVGSFVDKVRRWERTLNAVSECLEMWFTVQRKWMYLEGIFVGAEDIRQQLPEEAKRFDAIDKAFKGIMTLTSKNPNVVDACTADNRHSTLVSLSEKLDNCQKSLSDYLDTKRASFPRFFFISDDELLSVLGNSDPQSIQPHMLKLFDNVKSLTFGRGAKTVEALYSVEKEGFNVITPVTIDGPVESWMTAVEDEMHRSLRDITKEGVFNYAKLERGEWLRSVLGMVGLVGSQIWWTWEVEDAFRSAREGNKYAMKELERKLTGQLTDLVAMVRDQLDSITRKKVNTLLIIDVHARDIVDGFVRESILNAKEFAWESQLRFYWDRDVDDCVIRQCTGEFRYGYEYMGLNGRLVITPLTDRCYMTLTQALTFKLGGSPAGPAGTGKTETTKDLAKSLALPCFVINCGDGLDYKAMASTFSGLVQVGAWGCFDEFNRINIEVLSVVSAQLRAILNALLYDKPTCDIGIGGEMNIKRVAGFATCGFFITMNPGYAGRTELPDNLKALFRPVTMIVPDLLQICEIMLFSEGFEGAKILAKKMTVLYKLSKEQLSKQFHYDFGLRALKSVLVMAGGLKRQYQDMPEDLVLMRCLRDSNLPKFVFEDVPLFTGLINDLFPGMDCPRVGYENLKQAAMEDLENRGFRCSNELVFADQVDKVIQMYETQLVRHTTMIVGPTGGGKSLVLDTLRNARLASENVIVKMFVLNPKAQPLHELYGEMDPVTRDWTDGILSKLFRELNEPLPAGRENEMRWILYDGDVDALWVENMNSVMDDNRLLTLPNGERIRLQPHCAMICETFDLQYASPATISRCGMVWVDPKNLGYSPYFERWVRLRFGDGVKIEDEKQGAADILLSLYEKYVPKSVDLILSGMLNGEIGQRLRQVIPISAIGLVKQLCSTLDAFIEVSLTDIMDIEAMFLFCCIWSLGAALVGDSRVRYDSLLKTLSRDALPDGLLYDHMYDLNLHKWEKWQARVPAYVEPSPFRFYEVMVPTTDSVLYTHLLEHLAPRRPLLFVGESGTAKSTIILKYLSTLSTNSFARLNINFSSRTTAADVQTNIEANVDKRSGNIYGPAAGKRLCIFIDDLNMPKVDTYGTQQPIALLHFLMGRGCIYDREKDLALKHLRDLQYIGGMGPPGGGRNPVDPRFVALFNVFNLEPPASSVLHNIYNNIATARYAQFDEGVRAVVSKVTGVTLKLYSFILEKMPPTPSKFFYIFNLRDLSRVYEGLCNATVDVVKSPGEFVRLWRNECDRVFCDRLTTSEDEKIYASEMARLTKESFGDVADEVLREPCLFGDFECAPARIESEGTMEDPHLYRDMGDFDSVRKLFTEILELHNQDNKPMNLVLFELALEHLCRIQRIIRNPRGNALLVGVGGSGKQSLTRLAAFCAGYSLFQITLCRGYNEENFKSDLRELYKQLGQGEVVFLFTDAHVVEEGFLEFINNMLTTGMVPSLYEQDEKDALCATVRQEVRAAGIPETPDNLWSFYVNKCRNNLHIVLAMSPSGNKLRIRCRNFPGLVSNTVIDWFFPWPTDALVKVAQYFLADEALPPEHRDEIVNHFVYTHQTVTTAASRFAEELRRHYYITPKNYLDFISNYRLQLSTSGKTNVAAVGRLQGGLQKLIEAAVAVDEMKIVLTEKKVVVDAKTADVQALIAMIQEKTASVNTSRDEAVKKQKEAEEQSVIIASEKAKADEALQAAIPIVEAASAALANLDRASLTELKAFTSPPLPVKNVCMQLVLLRPTGEKLEENWTDAKKLLGNNNLLSLLQNYPKDSLKDSQVKKVNKYFSEEHSLKKMESVSQAGLGLMTWVVAIVRYYEVAKQVEPLRNKVREMEKAKAQTEKELAELKEMLSSLAAELESLNTQYASATAELDVLQSEASLMSRRLTAASQLIEGLTGERTRWSADIAALQEQSVKLVGDCLLGASFLSYTGAFTTDYRRDLIYDKFIGDVRSRGIPVSDNFSLENLLTTDATIQGWVSKGLPADDHSVQNGILTTKGSRFPLCIDPQQQAVGWIKRTYAGKNLTVKSLTDSDFMKHLELAIQFGNPFLFEGIDEELDPMLDPVLERNVVKEGSSTMIKLGDKMVEWDENFRLFFTTKLANPHYSPEVMGKTMIINYGVTADGLANQLLNVVVGNERPDLEKQWSELVTEMSENAQLLVSLEDSLLRELSSSQGNILDNHDLIATLENTKTKAVEIQSKLRLAEQTKGDISVARSVYKPVAKRGSILYFAEAGLSTISSMYEISLDSFLSVFKASLEAAKKDAALDVRLRNLIETITRQIYDYTCTGIFERHKLMFSFQMTIAIMKGDDQLEESILDFFLKGDTSLDAVSSPCPVTWLSASGWKDLLSLASLAPSVGELVEHFHQNSSEWRTWYDLETPEAVDLPGGFQSKLSVMQLLAVMRCFRTDRVYNSVKLFVMSIMGEKYVQPPVLDYARIFSQSTPSSPIIFILSPGADPQSDIQTFCDEMGMSQRFKFVALGQGQGPIAEQLLEAGYKRGHWILLQNCHLLTSWLKVLERMLNEMREPHKEFRLWLTTEPTDKFPLGILQRSLKVVTEPPDGLKLNMRATYSRLDTAVLEECPHIAFRSCLYVLAFLHAVVLERRKFGKIGWNVPYDFNESDFTISRKLLGLYLQKSFEDGDEFLPWGSLKYLIGDAMYGGRVSDDMDRRILVTYLEEYMGDFLFDDCARFHFSTVGFQYTLPPPGPLNNYRDVIETLPLTNSPAIFGLHPNAEIGYYTNAVKSMWVDLISLQPRKVGSGDGLSREDYIAATARDILVKIPIESMDVGSFDLLQTRTLLLRRNEALDDPIAGGTVTPCQVVLLQELERWNALVRRMAQSLKDLQRALIGEIGMSDELDSLGDSLFNSFLPSMWRRLTPDTQKPLGSWMLHFSRRHEQYADWIQTGEPVVMWLSGLHIPESYITALVQSTCRLSGWPLDKSTLYTVVTRHRSSEGLTKLETGSYITGLYLEGAAWDDEKCCLRHQDPKVLVVELPIMQIIPVESSKLKLHNTFRTPVYVTQARRNAMGVGLVFEADLATYEHSSHWVLQGVALTLNTDV